MSTTFLDAFRGVHATLNEINGLPQFERKLKHPESLTDNPSCFFLADTEDPEYSDMVVRQVVKNRMARLGVVIFRQHGEEEDAIEDLISDAQKVKDAIGDHALTRPGYLVSIARNGIEYESTVITTWGAVSIILEVAGYDFYS
jgi:hypothetical protein